MNYNASERRHVRSNAKAAKLADQQRTECIGGIMSVAPGRGWMHDLLESCHVFRTTFSGNALHGAFNEGARNIGLRLLNDIMSSCPDLYILMMREANERNITADVRRGNTNTDADTVHAGGLVDDDDGSIEVEYDPV